jgi:hypothetical protein
MTTCFISREEAGRQKKLSLARELLSLQTFDEDRNEINAFRALRDADWLIDH